MLFYTGTRIGFLLGLFLGTAITLTLSIGMYVLYCFVMSRVGRKFGVGSFPHFLVPVYNLVLLCDCARIGRWVAAVIILPVALHLLGVSYVGKIVFILTFVANVYLWGKIAERLGKNFWLWGILTPLLWFFPVLVLAFDSSFPVGCVSAAGGSRGSQESRYIDL